MMSSLVGVKEIRAVENGYIVEARYPYGGKPSGYGEVICSSIKDVHKLIDQIFECVEKPK